MFGGQAATSLPGLFNRTHLEASKNYSQRMADGNTEHQSFCKLYSKQQCVLSMEGENVIDNEEVLML